MWSTCSGPDPARPGVDVEKETVITGRVLAADGQPVGGAFVRLLDGTGEFTAEVVASGTGDFRFFAAPGNWTAACPVPLGQRRRHRLAPRQRASTTWTSPSRSKNASARPRSVRPGRGRGVPAPLGTCAMAGCRRPGLE